MYLSGRCGQVEQYTQKASCTCGCTRHPNWSEPLPAVMCGKRKVACDISELARDVQSQRQSIYVHLNESSIHLGARMLMLTDFCRAMPEVVYYSLLLVFLLLFCCCHSGGDKCFAKREHDTCQRIYCVILGVLPFITHFMH